MIEARDTCENNKKIVKEIKMKITRNQLRKLIETTIKPSIPKISSDNAITNIDVLANRPYEYDPVTKSRTNSNNLQADNLATGLEYPEGRSYSDDLETYKMAGRVTYDVSIVANIPGRRQHPSDEKYITIGVSFPLVDSVIDAYENFMDNPEGRSRINGSIVKTADALIKAKGRVFDHIRRTLINKKDIDVNDIIVISIVASDIGAAKGYRAPEYEEAMRVNPYEAGGAYGFESTNRGPTY